MRLLSGAICRPSIARLGVEKWIASLAASRANPSQSPDSAKRETTNATSGPEPRKSLPNSNPLSSLSKTSKGFWNTTTAPSGLPFKQWVTELRKDYSRRKKSVQHRFGVGFLSSHWRAPIASDVEGGVIEDVTGEASKMARWKLRDQVANWTFFGVNNPDDIRHGNGDIKIGGQARMFELPDSLSPAPTTTKNGHRCSPKCRRLNPHFVENLMGMPMTYTMPLGKIGYGRLAMESSHWLQLMRIALLQLGWR